MTKPNFRHVANEDDLQRKRPFMEDDLKAEYQPLVGSYPNLKDKSDDQIELYRNFNLRWSPMEDLIFQGGISYPK